MRVETQEPPLAAAFDRRLRESPDSTAVIQLDAAHSYRALAGAVHACAGALRGLGVGPGDVVSLQLPNWIETIIIYLAVNRIGAIANPIIPIYREYEVEFILRESRSRVLFLPQRYRDRRYVDMLASLRAPTLAHVVVCHDRRKAREAPTPGTIDFETLLGRSAGEAPAAAVGAGDDALLLYTSGTEANPKGARHSHAGLDAEARSMIGDSRLSPGAALFIASPLGHIAGIDFAIHLPLTLGARVCLMDEWNAAAAVEMIARENCAWSTGVTPFLEGLIGAPEAQGALTRLNGYRCGGADVPPRLIRMAHRLGLFAYRTYGSTEHPTVTGRGGDPEKAATTDGLPVAGTTVKITDPEDAALGLATGAIGEICTKGPELFLGYRDPALNAQAFDAEGWFRTGDLGWLDADGYLTIAGRKKDIIIRKGENISAKQLEDLLVDHPAIDQIAVIGLPDPVRGERICAVVVAKPEATVTIDGLADWLDRQGIARQKFPEQLEQVTAMPRTATGKIRKSELRSRFG